jgi:APA family basic amino acid/polyamine antiporter
VRLLVWMIIGFDVYLFYGMKNSLLSDNNQVTLMKSTRTISWIGVALTGLLIGVAIIHHHITDGADTGLYYFSLVFAAAHFILYVFKAATAANVKAK